MSVKGVLAYAQIRDGSVTKALLEPAVKATLDQVPVVAQDLSDLIGSKGQPNGLATLGNTGSLTANQINSIALKGKALPVNSEAEMLAITHTKDGNPMEQGDRVDRLDVGRTYIFDGGDLTDPGNWSKILAEDSAVTTLTNVAGTVSESGVVTLANIAFTGAMADLIGAAPVASSGAASDLNVIDAADRFVATDAEGVLEELDVKIDAAEQAAATAATNAQNTAIASSRLVSFTLTPGADDATKSFDGIAIDTGAHYRVLRNGVDERQSGLAIVDEAAKTVSFSYDVLSDEAVTIEGYPA